MILMTFLKFALIFWGVYFLARNVGKICVMLLGLLSVVFGSLTVAGAKLTAAPKQKRSKKEPTTQAERV